MTQKGISRKLEPLLGKLLGKFPLCPWRTVFWPLNPKLLRAYPPPQAIEIVAEEAERKLLRFDRQHALWFPRETAISAEMWSEYLSVFWNHPANAHRYLAHGNFIEAEDICIDCGACEGTFALQALGAGAGKVICIEPAPALVACLKQTLAREIETGRANIQEFALGATDGESTFAFDPAHPFGGSSSGRGVRFAVRTRTLSTLCQQLGLERIDFIKMDIEGAEMRALEGALPMLRKFRPRLAITTYHRSFDYAALKAMLVAAGYDSIKPVGCTDRDGGVFRPVLLHAFP